jgi:hypothetical protein
MKDIDEKQEYMFCSLLCWRRSFSKGGKNTSYSSLYPVVKVKVDSADKVSNSCPTLTLVVGYELIYWCWD